MEHEGGDMTFWDQLKDAFNRFFGVMDEPMPIWKTLALFALLIGVVITCVWCGREKSEPEDEPESLVPPELEPPSCFLVVVEGVSLSEGSSSSRVS